MDIVNGLLNLPDNVIGVRLPKIADDAAVVFPPFDWIDPDDHDFDSTWSGQLWRNLGAAPPHSREETTIAAFKSLPVWNRAILEVWADAVPEDESLKQGAVRFFHLLGNEAYATSFCLPWSTTIPAGQQAARWAAMVAVTMENEMKETRNAMWKSLRSAAIEAIKIFNTHTAALEIRWTADHVRRTIIHTLGARFGASLFEIELLKYVASIGKFSPPAFDFPQDLKERLKSAFDIVPDGLRSYCLTRLVAWLYVAPESDVANRPCPAGIRSYLSVDYKAVIGLVSQEGERKTRLRGANKINWASFSHQGLDEPVDDQFLAPRAENPENEAQEEPAAPMAEQVPDEDEDELFDEPKESEGDNGMDIVPIPGDKEDPHAEPEAELIAQPRQRRSHPEPSSYDEGDTEDEAEPAAKRTKMAAKQT